MIESPHARLLRLASTASLATATTLVLAKALAWWLSGSVALLAGLTDSLLDCAASLLNLIAIHYALRPADDDHRYGHGKAEGLAGLGQALFIAASAVLVGLNGVERLHNPQPLAAEGIGIAVMLLSLVLTAALLLFQRKVVRLTGSTAINADSLHYRSDLLLNAGILVALLLSRFGWTHSDALFGIGIAFYILWSALSIARQALTVLMDEELTVDISQRMHEELPDYMPLVQAHALCEQVEHAIRAEYPQSEVLVHADPIQVVAH
jgi:ferrous-iron efflux pump FieF